MFSKLLKRWRWILIGLGTLMVGGLVAGWFLFQHVPAWYQPMHIPWSDLQRVRNDLSVTFDSLSATLNTAQQPFKLKLSQDQLNAWLAAREGIDPKTREWLPRRLSEPMVILEPGGIRLAATYTDGSLQAIVSAKLALTASAEGITAKLEDIRGGSLSLPDGVIRRGLRAFDRLISPKLADANVAVTGGQRPRLRDLPAGITLPNTARLPGGGQRFRVLNIEFEMGAVVLTLERLPYQPPTR